MSRSTFDTDPTADSYYDRLGITKQARPATVEQAGRAAIDKHHPDAGTNDDAFAALKQARDSLLDSLRRRTYDMFLSRFTAVEEATRAFEKWQARGEPEPQTWLDGYHHVCYDDASPASDADTTAEVAVLPSNSTDSRDSDDSDPNPLYGGTVSGSPTVE